MRSLVIVAVCIALVVVGCGSSSPANTAIYTITPKGGVGADILFVTFSGPPAAARSVMRAFEATRKGDYMIASTPIGQTRCDTAAGDGKVKISVVSAIGLNPSLSQTLCSSISGRF